jgi:predicted Fe-Mo cluster-binding NifX family protein
MDTAGRILIVDFDDRGEVSRETILLPKAESSDRVKFLKDLGVDVLICGAITRRFERILQAAGIEPHPWLGGDVEEIVAAYPGGILNQESLLLPGRGRRQRGARGRGRMRGPGRGRRNRFQEE